MSKGVNSNREYYNGCCYSTHAEMEAISKLPPQKLKNNKKIINLFVVRVTKLGLYKNSKPCSKCIKHLQSIKNYKIKYVYYSDSNGDIVREKFNKLVNSTEHYITRGFR